MKNKPYLGALLHLGLNMWDDFGPEGPDGRAKSKAEKELKPNPMAPNGQVSRYCSYVRTDDALWRKSVDDCAAAGLNMVVVDIGEAVRFPSHPELAVAGTWPVEKMRAELDRMRKLGLEPVPKLNFASSHDAWLKWYHAMLSTPEYYKVVADVIRDTCEIFDHPKYFHLGWDEEEAVMFKRCFRADVRKGDLWWQDYNFSLKEVMKHGARPIVFPDRLWWGGPEEFLKRANHDVVFSNWHYRTQAENDLETAKLIPCKVWADSKVNSAASFRWLDENGFDQFPCVSNIYNAESVDYVIGHCRKVISDRHLVGFCMAAWRNCYEEKAVNYNRLGNELLVAAYRKHYAS